MDGCFLDGVAAGFVIFPDAVFKLRDYEIHIKHAAKPYLPDVDASCVDWVKYEASSKRVLEGSYWCPGHTRPIDLDFAEVIHLL